MQENIAELASIIQVILLLSIIILVMTLLDYIITKHYRNL